MKFNIANIKTWMRKNYLQFVDKATNEISRTDLAEGAAEESDQNSEDGPLDDIDHWIWSCAHEIACEYEEGKFSK